MVDSCAVNEASLLQRNSKYALHNAAQVGDVGKIESLLAGGDSDADYVPYSKLSEVAPTLDVNARDNMGCTVLHVAILNKQLDACRTAIKYGAKLGLRCNGSPALHICIAMASLASNLDFSLQLLPLLLSSNADPLGVDDHGRTPLHLAASLGLVSMARVLEEHNGEAIQTTLHLTDKSGSSPLHLAAAGHHIEMVNWLLERKASCTAQDKHKNTPVHIAAMSGFVLGVEAFIKAAPEATEIQNVWGKTPADVVMPLYPSTSPACLLVTHEECLHHHTCGPITREISYIPPENTARLHVLLNDKGGTLRTDEFVSGRCTLDIRANAPKAKLSDITRVHAYEYIRRILLKVGDAQEAARQAQVASEVAAQRIEPQEANDVKPSEEFDGPEPTCPTVKLVDLDTAVSGKTWDAALRAAGAACAAVDAVVTGAYRTAFCAIRPPGHHAGPFGIVASEKDPEGSHGFCILNNVAIAAAYAMHHYGRPRFDYGSSLGIPSSETMVSGTNSPPPVIKRVAIFDFDVHHGNGTEECLRSLCPQEHVELVNMPYGRAAISTWSYRPWLDELDGSNVLFISSHGFGPKRDEDGNQSGWFYPGSGDNAGWDPSVLDAVSGHIHHAQPLPTSIVDGSLQGTSEAVPKNRPQYSLIPPNTPAPEPIIEQKTTQPNIINIAMSAKQGPKSWQRIMQSDVLPRLDAFKPDLILVSAGFDAHKADPINVGYMRLGEEDYYWITKQLVKIANKHAQGRIISVLEGGYRVQGGIVSPFGRAVASHVRALSSRFAGKWDAQEERQKLLREIQWEKQQVEAANAAVADLVTATAAEHPGIDTTTGAIVSPATPLNDEGVGRRSKRKRTSVDYVALDAKLAQPNLDVPNAEPSPESDAQSTPLTVDMQLDGALSPPS